MQLKLTWKEFCNLATRELDYPKTEKPLEFVVSRSYEGEHQIAETPDFVYIEVNKPNN